MMTDTQMLEELESLGTEQNRKIYKRHGVEGNLYGVSYANLKKLHKKIKVDHDLAQQFWSSRNHDARTLAMMIADPDKADDKLLEKWVHDLGNYMAANALTGYVAKTRLAREKMEQWTSSTDEWVGTVGWNLLGYLAMNDQTLSEDYFEKYLSIIERDIHTAKNRVRYAMNNALIAIGIRNSELELKGLAVAQKIGKVNVDHSDTSCKTPDAASYIRKAVQRKA